MIGYYTDSRYTKLNKKTKHKKQFKKKLWQWIVQWYLGNGEHKHF